MTAITNVALLGTDGNLGPSILQALLSNNFKVTILKRSSSKSADNYPLGVSNIARIPDDFNHDALVSALQNQQALVITVKGSQTDLQLKLARAAIAAGVRRLIPADFGSCDSSSAWAQKLVPLFQRKTDLRDQLIQLSEQYPTFTWTSLVCGHFFDWSPEFLHVWVRERRVEILDDGNVKWSASTLGRIGEATVAILRRPEQTGNRVLFVQSFCVSQNEVLDALRRATDAGGREWEVKKFQAKEYEREEKAKADAGDLEAVENLVWLLGTIDGDWTTREGFGMDLLGLKDEDLDTVVRKIVKKHDQK